VNRKHCWRLLLPHVMVLAAIPSWGQVPTNAAVAATCTTQALAGTIATCSIAMSTGSLTADFVNLAISVTPSAGAPALSGSLSFTDLLGSGGADTAGTVNSITLQWSGISPALSGSRTLGSVRFTIPAAAALGQTYTLGFTGVTARLGLNPLAVSSSGASVLVSNVAQLEINSPTSLPAGTVGALYSALWFSATGGAGAQRWSASGLPAGLGFTTDGFLSGIPTQFGTFTPQFIVIDSSGSATLTLPLIVAAPGSSCTYTLTPGSSGFGPAGGTGSVNVSAGSGCVWSAAVSSGASWLTLTGAASGMGAGSVSYQVAADTGVARGGALTIGGNTFLVAQTGASSAPAGSLPHFAAGAGWTTTITILNLWPVTEQVHLAFFDDSGSPVSLSVLFPLTGGAPQTLSTVDRTLGPGAQLIVKTANASAQADTQGWMQLVTDGKVDGSCIFSFSAAGGVQEAVVRNEDRNASAFLLAFDNTGGVRTGVAITNISNQAIAVPVILRDSAGTQLGTATVNLSAHGHTSFMLDDRYPLTSGQFGAAEFDVPTGAQIGILGIRAQPSGAITSVPVLSR
jgi:hypothetical protein